MNPNQSRPRIDVYAENLNAAEDAVQSAKNSGDAQAQGYAEGNVLRWKRELALLDPRGVGYAHLGTLSDAARAKALGVEGMSQGQTLEDALHWAEHHAASNVAEHNKQWFSREAARIREAIASR